MPKFIGTEICDILSLRKAWRVPAEHRFNARAINRSSIIEGLVQREAGSRKAEGTALLSRTQCGPVGRSRRGLERGETSHHHVGAWGHSPRPCSGHKMRMSLTKLIHL